MLKCQRGLTKKSSALNICGAESKEKEFEPYKGKIRKSGTGCVTMINDHLYEGRFTPTNADGKRIYRNIYAQTREECEEKLAVLIVEMRAEIKAEKVRRKQAASA